MLKSSKADSYTRKLVEWVTNFSYEDLPSEAIDAIKLIVLDTLGAMLVGSTPVHRASWLAGDLAKSMGGKPECTVVGRDFKTDCQSAALANGIMGYAADIEGAGTVGMHTAAVQVPTCLVMAEREKADGVTFMAALTVAYEVASRVNYATLSSSHRPYPHSFHPSAVFGTFGAAAGAGYILELKQEQLAYALGLAGTIAGGLVTWLYDSTEDSRPFVIGIAARNGVTSAMLAEIGFGGPATILDPDVWNIYDAYSGEMHLERLTEDLDSSLYVTQATRIFKRYACCFNIHSGLEALLKILNEQNLSYQDILQVTHGIKPGGLDVINNNPLRSHCAQYMLAVAAVNRKIVPGDIYVDRRADPRIAEMERRISLVGDPELESAPAGTPAKLEVMTKDGRRFAERVDWPKGSGDKPMTAGEVEEKFMELATSVVPTPQAEKLRQMVLKLENVDNLGEVADLLQVKR
jgi:2-methylcitrate dehydratase PrpD